MQQFLLPSSEGGSSQIINIPISLLSQGNQPISFITANGQIFQLPNFSAAQGENSNTSGSSASATVNATSSSTASTASTTPATATATPSSQQQALVINSQGQIISLPVLQPQGSTTTPQAQPVQQQQQNTQVMSTNLNNFNQNTSNNQQTTNTTNANNNSNNSSNNQQQTVSLSQINFASLANNNGGVQQLQTLNNTPNRNNNVVTTTNAQGQVHTGTPIKTLLEDDDKEVENTELDGGPNDGPTIANMPAGMGSATNLTGMPSHVTHHATTVDGVNLDEIREFAKAFKLRRLALGLTQTQVGQALSATKGPAYSQSAICRFEKLDITPKSAAKIKPVLEKWMQEAELKYADRLGLKTGNQQNFADLLGSDSTKKRKRRTSFTPQALEILNEAFEKNTHPSGTGDLSNQGADMTMLANKLNYDREVIRVWFCNKRQALKNTIKKFKTEGPGGLNDTSEAMSPSDENSPNQSLNTSSQQIQQIQQQQQQLQQSPIQQQNNVHQVQSTVNVVSSISQSCQVVTGSPKTVITLQAPSSSTPVPQTQTSSASSPQQLTTTQNQALLSTTLKIESSQTPLGLNGTEQLKMDTQSQNL